jgi:hypothetical protein
MFKSVFAAAAALSMSTGAALAGPYVNVETNAGWVGDDYSGATTDLHIGYEGDLGENAGWYIQGGPAIVAPDGEESETEISGKVGASVALTESLGAYGELSMITADQDFDDLNVGGKLGLKYNF